MILHKPRLIFNSIFVAQCVNLSNHSERVFNGTVPRDNDRRVLVFGGCVSIPASVDDWHAASPVLPCDAHFNTRKVCFRVDCNVCIQSILIKAVCKLARQNRVGRRGVPCTLVVVDESQIPLNAVDCIPDSGSPGSNARTTLVAQ